MREFVTRSLETILNVLSVVIISVATVGGIVTGYSTFFDNSPAMGVAGAVVGLIVGILAVVVTFGLIYLLLDIRALLEDISRMLEDP